MCPGLQKAFAGPKGIVFTSTVNETALNSFKLHSFKNGVLETATLAGSNT